jgi:hypothetical protein
MLPVSTTGQQDHRQEEEGILEHKEEISEDREGHVVAVDELVVQRP